MQIDLFFSSYIFISPNVVRPGRDFIIQGKLLESPREPVTIKAELTNSAGNIASAQVTVDSEQGKI